MFECGDLCMPVNWSATTDVRYLSARNVVTSRRAQYGDIFCSYAGTLNPISSVIVDS